MANSAAKKVVKSNRRRLKNVIAAVAITNAIFFLIRYLLFKSTFTRSHSISWVILIILYALPLTLLITSARPQYAEDGTTLIHGGHDISKPGLLEYAHDTIYITIVTHVCLMFTRWALLIFVFALAYVAYAVLNSMGFSPFGGGGKPDDVSAAQAHDEQEDYASLSRKDRRKAERQAQKQKR